MDAPAAGEYPTSVPDVRRPRKLSVPSTLAIADRPMGRDPPWWNASYFVENWMVRSKFVRATIASRCFITAMRYSSWMTAGPSKPNALLAIVLKSSWRQLTPTNRCVRWKLPAPIGNGNVVGRFTTVKSGSSGRSFASSSSAACAGGCDVVAGSCARAGVAFVKLNPKNRTKRAEKECRVTARLLSKLRTSRKLLEVLREDVERITRR